MQKIDEDRAFLISALRELPDFLLSKDIYWPVDAQPRGQKTSRLPQMSLGNVRLASARLRGRDADLVAGIDHLFDKWRSTWAKKAALEYSNRLKLWEGLLEELIDDPSEAIYRYQIRTRVILELLLADLLKEPPQHELDLLAGLDARLRAESIESEFIWAGEIQATFPPERFWYLYRSIQKQK